jgi:hypothetical protein
MLKKNPNAFFYRHNPPGEDSWVVGLCGCYPPHRSPRFKQSFDDMELSI